MAVVVAVVVAGGMVEALDSRRASWLSVTSFGLLLISYAFLIWFSFLGGHQLFLTT